MKPIPNQETKNGLMLFPFSGGKWHNITPSPGREMVQHKSIYWPGNGFFNQNIKCLFFFDKIVETWIFLSADLI